MRILLIEDEQAMADSLKAKLKHRYTLEFAKTGKYGLSLAKNNSYDTIVIDLGLPDMTGLEVCQELRVLDKTTPVLILTGSDDLDDKVNCLDAGADDYLLKPFDFPELEARIRALIRRKATPVSPAVLKAGDLSMDLATYEVKRAGQPLKLRRKELDLLEYMLRNQGRVVTRQMLLESVWNDDLDVFTSAINVHIKRLRDKVDRPFSKKLIKTVYGIGYTINDN